MSGNSLTEVINGSGDGLTSTGTKIFKTVTQIASGAAASAVNVGTKSAFVDLAGKGCRAVMSFHLFSIS